MQLSEVLEKYPKAVALRDGSHIVLRPLQAVDEEAFHAFFCAVPAMERLLFKDRVTERAVIHDWCQHVNYERILPLLAFAGDRIVADATLHQTLGGWKRHIGQIRVVVHPDCRGKGIATRLVTDLLGIARDAGLEKLEAEFMGEQQSARRMFALLGFNELLVLPEYVKDMQALPHDYVLMGRHIVTDEEFAGTG